MVDEVDTRVSPSLHPANVRKVDGWCEETEAVLAPTEDAFRRAYTGIRDVHNAREAARQNPAWNEPAQVIATQEFAEKVQDRITRTFDSVRDRLVKGIASLEKELSAPVESKASLSISEEIRRHVKGLGTGERMSFIRNAMMDDDEKTVSAILGAPAYLAGLDPKMADVLLREYHSRSRPEVANRLKAMVGAKELIESKAGLVFSQLEAAVGMAPHQVKRLRDAKSAAEAAMVLRDVA